MGGFEDKKKANLLTNVDIRSWVAVGWGQKETQSRRRLGNEGDAEGWASR